MIFSMSHFTPEQITTAYESQYPEPGLADGPLDEWLPLVKQYNSASASQTANAETEAQAVTSSLPVDPNPAPASAASPPSDRKADVQETPSTTTSAPTIQAPAASTSSTTQANTAAK
ncbi:hypothetical protein PG994_008632 [Apiospora phragmitis]|uniref:Uncharacterized protein n=1 Tax=Apiospora phragmitis TaxID=2905665 RepID=A0ABR1UH10_9PEZI